MEEHSAGHSFICLLHSHLLDCLWLLGENPLANGKGAISFQGRLICQRHIFSRNIGNRFRAYLVPGGQSETGWKRSTRMSRNNCHPPLLTSLEIRVKAPPGDGQQIGLIYADFGGDGMGKGCAHKKRVGVTDIQPKAIGIGLKLDWQNWGFFAWIIHKDLLELRMKKLHLISQHFHSGESRWSHKFTNQILWEN